MKKLGLATVAASGLAAAVLGLAGPADAAPTSPGDAQKTISMLEAQGYHVIVNKLGHAPIEEATVVEVRAGQTYSRTDSGVPGNLLGVGTPSQSTTLIAKTVYVDVT